MQSSRRILLAYMMVPALVSLALGEFDNSARAQTTNSTTANPPHTQSSGQPRKPAAPPTATPIKPAAPASPKTDALEQALRQKMNELNGPAAPATTAAPAATPKPTVATPAASTPPPAPAPAAATAAAATATATTAAVGQDKISPPPDVVLPAGANASDIDKARAALRQKMSDLNTQDGTAGSATGAMASAATPQPERVVIVTGSPIDTKVSDPARDAAVKSAVQEAAMANQGRPASAGMPATTSSTKSSTQFAPLNAPPLPISMPKEERLRALLSQYQADQISPEQYHEQRAKILAEP